MKTKQYLFLFILSLTPMMNKLQAQKVSSQFKFKKSPSFIENKGQISNQNGRVRSDVRYIYDGGGMKVIFLNNAVSYELYTLKENKSKAEAIEKPQNLSEKLMETKDVEVTTNRIDLTFLGANHSPEIIAEEVNDDFSNYYLAHTPEKGINNVRSYRKLTYRNIYPNIDFVYYAGSNGKMKYDIVLHPGADASMIRIKSNGADLSLKDNRIIYNTSLGKLTESIPYSYYKESGKSVGVTYTFSRDGIIGFKSEISNQTLVIDPSLEWGTYYGGTNADYGQGITTDKVGNVYMTGYTLSTSGIATSGALRYVNAGANDAYIVKFNSAGNRLWGTYYGGNNYDNGLGITTDSLANIYITGLTASDSGIATPGAYRTTYSGQFDAYVAKFDSLGARLWGSYYGGNYNEYSYSVACDKLLNVYIVGYTQSDTGIATAGAHQTSSGGGQDAFVAKFNNSGTLQWSTFYGGSGTDYAQSVSTDDSSNIYVTGATISSSGISTAGSYQINRSGGNDAFIAKFSNSGSLMWGTYFGGSGGDYGQSIALDDSANIYITGYTGSSSGVATSGAHQTSWSGVYDVFIAKFNRSGSRLWSTYYGGSGGDYANYIVTDKNANLYITGYTLSNSGIASVGAPQNTWAGMNDGFVSQFSSSGTFLWGTYYGGSLNDYGYALAIDNSSNVYVTGNTNSTSGIATSGAHLNSFAGNVDAFIVKLTTITCSTPQALAGRDTVVCGQRNIQLGASAQSGHFYTWTSNPAGFTNSTSNPQVSPFQTTTYYLKDSVATGCVGYDTVVITVNPLPAPNAGADQIICSGSSIQIGNSAQSGHSYKWSGSNGYTSTTANPTISPTISETYILFDSITATGCINRDTVAITVHPLPTPNAGIDQNIYAGNSINIGSSGVAGHTYRWSSSPAGFSGSGAQVNVSPSSTTTYILKDSINSTGCVGFDTVVITVQVMPVFTKSADITHVCCDGASTGKIIVSVSGGTAPYTYQLNAGTPQSSNVFNSLSHGSYLITISDATSALDTLRVIITQPSDLTPTITWTGAVDSVWTKASNWNPATRIPNSSDIVRIPAAVTNNPSLNGSANVKGLRLVAGATLNLNSSSFLNILQTMSIEGQLNARSGTIIYKGNGGIPAANYNALKVESGAQVNVCGNILVKNNLMIAVGTNLYDSGYQITVKGDVLNDGIHTSKDTGAIVLNHPGSPTLYNSGSGMIAVFGNVYLRSGSGGRIGNSALSGLKTIITGTLRLESGDLNINGNRLEIGDSIASAGYIVSPNGRGIVSTSTASQLIIRNNSQTISQLVFGIPGNVVLRVPNGVKLGGDSRTLGNLDLSSGTRIDLNGKNLTIGSSTTNAASFSGNGNISGTSGALNILGSPTSTNLNGIPADTLPRLILSRKGGLILNKDLYITGLLSISSGVLNLNGNVIQLGPTALLSETQGNKVSGNSGYIITRRKPASTLTNVNVGGLGLVITRGYTDSITVKRSHAVIYGNISGSSIERVYSVNSNDTGLVKWVFNYDSTERAVNANQLGMNVSQDGGLTWQTNPSTKTNTSLNGNIYRVSSLNYLITASDQLGSPLLQPTVLNLSNKTSNQIQLYPNPFSDGLTIKTAEPMIYTIIDITGKVMATGTTDKGIQYISSGNWSAGMYILKTPHQTLKMIKQ